MKIVQKCSRCTMYINYHYATSLKIFTIFIKMKMKYLKLCAMHKTAESVYYSEKKKQLPDPSLFHSHIRTKRL